MWSLKRFTFPLLEESGTLFPEQAWLQRITKALSQKVTQACREHLHSTAWAEIRAWSIYFSTSKILQSKQAKMWARQRTVRFYSNTTLSSWIQIGLHMPRGEKQNKCQSLGCCDKLSFLTCFTNSIWREQQQKQALPICIISIWFSYW